MEFLIIALVTPHDDERLEGGRNPGTYRKPPVEHLVLEDVGEGGGVPGQQVRVPRRGELP